VRKVKRRIGQDTELSQKRSPECSTGNADQGAHFYLEMGNTRRQAPCTQGQLPAALSTRERYGADAAPRQASASPHAVPARGSPDLEHRARLRGLHTAPSCSGSPREALSSTSRSRQTRAMVTHHYPNAVDCPSSCTVWGPDDPHPREQPARCSELTKQDLPRAASLHEERDRHLFRQTSTT